MHNFRTSVNGNWGDVLMQSPLMRRNDRLLDTIPFMKKQEDSYTQNGSMRTEKRTLKLQMY